MELTVKNAWLRLTVDTLGAQMLSLMGKDGHEYLWQGDPAYWSDRAPVLFPFIGRLENKQYRAEGKTYTMGIHGFAAQSAFQVTAQGEDCLVLTLQSSPATRDCYPYDFSLEIAYRLVGSTLQVQNRVRNDGTAAMHFALGGHPGFRVPLADGEQFTDCCLEFSEDCAPERIGFTPDTVLCSGEDVLYPLEDGRLLPLHHGLFDDDAIILRNMARQVTLKSKSSAPSITVTYPDMPYLGIWHWPGKDAPYVCIEPWTSLPGRSGVLEDIALRSDFIHLAPGQVWENTWTVTLSQED